MQIKFKSTREKVLIHFFETVGPIHDVFYKHRPDWGLTTASLLKMPVNSLGNKMGLFLQTDNLEPISRAERHDVFHVLLQYSTTVREETGMQFCIFGAGKQSPSVIATMLLGIIFLPEYWKYFYEQYLLGKQYLPFYNLPFQYLLNSNIDSLRATIYKRKS